MSPVRYQDHGAPLIPDAPRELVRSVGIETRREEPVTVRVHRHRVRAEFDEQPRGDPEAQGAGRVEDVVRHGVTMRARVDGNDVTLLRASRHEVRVRREVHNEEHVLEIVRMPEIDRNREDPAARPVGIAQVVEEVLERNTAPAFLWLDGDAIEDGPQRELHRPLQPEVSGDSHVNGLDVCGTGRGVPGSGGGRHRTDREEALLRVVDECGGEVPCQAFLLGDGNFGRWRRRRRRRRGGEEREGQRDYHGG